MTEYVMSRTMFNALIKAFRAQGLKVGNPKQTVIKYLNATAGIKGEIVDLHVEE